MIKTNEFFPFIQCQNSTDNFTDFLSNFENSLYNISFDGMWKHYQLRNLELPQSGWKGHIAALPEDIEEIFKLTYSVLTAHQCTFKVARSRKVYEALSDPHASVTEANKFMTFYPSNNTEFRKVVKELNDKLAEYSAPTIFTDYQLPKHSPVQFRYGAFTELKKWDSINKCFIDLMELPNGNIIEDDRTLSFNIPEGISLPFIQKDSSWVEELDVEVENPNLKKYVFLSTLSQKNKGDVYLAKNDHKKVIVKTANPYIRNRINSSDAQKLLLNEAKFLKKLEYTGVVPKLLNHFKVDNVAFNVTSYIDGISLDDTSLIGQKKSEVIYALCKTVYTLHKNNVIIGDLTNSNFIFSKGTCYLVDLEYLSFTNKKIKREGYTPYYIPIDNKEKFLSQKEDIFSLAVTILAILLGNLPKYNSKNIDDAIKILNSEIYAGIHLNKKNSKLFFLAYDLLNLSSSKNRYSPSQLKKIIDKKNYKSKIIPFSDQYQINTLTHNLERLKNTVKVYDEIGLHKKWWKSGEFGEQMSPLSLQHGIIGVDCALGEKSFKNLTDLPQILANNHNFKYSESYLFGSASLLWKFGYEYQNKQITYIEFKDSINTIVKTWSTDESNNDFALGTAGKLYSLIFILLLDPTLYDVRKKAKKLYSNLKSGINKKHISFSTTFDRLNFAHGLSGTTYVLLVSALYFKDAKGIKLATNNLSFIDSFILKEFDDKTITNYMYFSWCEGLSGIGSALIRSQNLLRNKIHYKSLNKISFILQKNSLRVDGSWCHGRSSIINFFSDMYVRKNHIEYFNSIKYLSLYEFCTAIELETNILAFIDETGFLHSLDFGVGQVGILKTISDALQKRDRLFFLTNKQEKTLTDQYITD